MFRTIRLHLRTPSAGGLLRSIVLQAGEWSMICKFPNISQRFQVLQSRAITTFPAVVIVFSEIAVRDAFIQQPSFPRTIVADESGDTDGICNSEFLLPPVYLIVHNTMTSRVSISDLTHTESSFSTHHVMLKTDTCMPFTKPPLHSPYTLGILLQR